jgi:hypothetical protein
MQAERLTGPNDSMRAHRPEQGMESRRLLAEEIPSGIVSSRCLRDLAIRRRFDRMNKIGELNGILDEEDWDVVADNI